MKLSNDGKTLLEVNDSDVKKDGSFDIPQGVTSIGTLAFHNCTGLQSITIPEGITSIGDSAFKSCIGLQSIIIPEGVTSIGVSAFNRCSGLQSITIPEGVTSISDFAFYGCSKLQSITIPEGVASIGNFAFYGCSKLQSITIPEGVTSIGNSVFNYSSLHSIVIAVNADTSLQRVTNLLPKDLKDKVISKDWAEEVFRILNIQLSRIAQTPEINTLYHFFNYKAPYVSKITVENKALEKIEKECSKLPNDIFAYMNPFLLSENSYYQEAQMLMYLVPLPKNEDELVTYDNKLKGITDKCIEKAKEFSGQAPMQKSIEKIKISHKKMIFWAETPGSKCKSLLDEEKDNIQHRQ